MADVDVRLDPNWQREIERITTQEFEEAADELADTARANAPTATGDLRASIEGEYEGGVVEARATVPYARFVEDGTRHMAAQPFLRPALIAVVAKRYGL